MIERIIRWSAANRLIVLLAAAFLAAAGVFAVSRTPLDALPDLSDVQVVVLDEADHMSELGFLEPVQRILRLTADGAQKLMFSATLDR